MTDKAFIHRAVSELAGQKLTDRPVWEKATPRLVPDYEKVRQLLADFDAVGTQVAGLGSQGYTSAKDRAGDAAMRVVKGLRNVQLNYYRPELAQAAAYQKSELDELRDENPVRALAAIAAAGLWVACGAGEALRLDMVALDEGYFTGLQLLQLGVGEVLGNAPLPE